MRGDVAVVSAMVEDEETTRRRLEKHWSLYEGEEEDLVIHEVEEGEGSEAEEEFDEEEEKDFCEGYALVGMEERKHLATENRTES